MVLSCLDFRLYQRCNSAEKMRKAGLEFVDMITKLLQRLLEYRHIIQDEIKDHRMSCIVNLLVRRLLFYYNPTAIQQRLKGEYRSYLTVG